MAEESIIVIGGGGHSSALIGVLKANGARIQGIVTQDTALVELHGVPVLGLEGTYAIPPGAALVNGVGNKASSQGSGLAARAEVYKRYRKAGFTLASVISAQAVVMSNVNLGAGVQVMPGAILQAGVMVGENAIINTGAILDHDVVVAPHAHIAPGAVLCGGVSVGEATHIGAGAVVIQGIKIGSNAVIGAGVTVKKDVADGAVVA